MSPQASLFPSPRPGPAHYRFDGPAYDPAKDEARLTGQLLRIFALMKDSRWRTLAEIEAATGDPQASISAQVRHLRKPRFGAHRVAKRRRGAGGTWEYKLTAKEKSCACAATL